MVKAKHDPTASRVILESGSLGGRCLRYACIGCCGTEGGRKRFGHDNQWCGISPHAAWKVAASTQSLLTPPSGGQIEH